MGEDWRRYCEAWEHAFKKKDPRLRGLIFDKRGKEGVELIRRNIAVVKRDVAGEIEDRATLPSLLK